ncbi:MAG: hypothetical protein ACK5M3_15040 [Dysgonomonas sp.]
MLSAGLIFLPSCSDNDDVTDPETPIEETAVYLPSKISSPKGDLKFSYDDSDKITKMEWTDKTDTRSNYAIILSYDAQGRVSRVDRDLTGINQAHGYLVTYGAGGKVDVTEDTSLGGNTLEIFIDDEGYYISSVDAATLYYKYDTNGNIIEEKHYQELEKPSYDDKNGVYKHVKTPKWALTTTAISYIDEDFLSRNWYNNIVKLDRTISIEGGDDMVYVKTYDYQYNEDGYPTKADVVGTFGDAYTIGIEYIKK